uniref:Uncharacterized protein n=1 Tax=Theropithecus gelada TaxID=9565 RepID=A0A8D2FW62_THEGE
SSFSRGGSVVIVASIAAFSPFPVRTLLTGLSPYSVSKTALLGLTKTLAIELAPRNIRVNFSSLSVPHFPPLKTSSCCSARTRKKRKE